MLTRGFEQGEKASEAVIGIKRQGDAGEIDQPRRYQAVGELHPVSEFEQVARRGTLAPIAEAAFAGRAVFNEGQSRQPAGNAQDEVPGNALGGGERHDAVGIGIVSERGGKTDIDAGAGEIDGGIERVAAAGEREPAVGAARQLDQTSPTQTTRGFCSLIAFSPARRKAAAGKEIAQRAQDCDAEADGPIGMVSDDEAEPTLRPAQARPRAAFRPIAPS